MVNKPGQAAKGRPATQVQHAFQSRVIMMFLADLDEKDPAAKMIHHMLPSAEVPPLDRKIVFPSGGDDPVGNVRSCDLFHLRRHGSFLGRKVDIPLEQRGMDSQLQFLIQVIYKPVKKVDWALVGLVDQRIMAHHRFDFRIIGIKRCQKWIILPQLRRACPNVGQKFSTVTLVKIAYGSRQHDDVAGRLEVGEDQFSHFKGEDSVSAKNGVEGPSMLTR